MYPKFCFMFVKTIATSRIPRLRRLTSRKGANHVVNRSHSSAQHCMVYPNTHLLNIHQNQIKRWSSIFLNYQKSMVCKSVAAVLVMEIFLLPNIKLITYEAQVILLSQNISLFVSSMTVLYLVCSSTAFHLFMPSVTSEHSKRHSHRFKILKIKGLVVSFTSADHDVSKFLFDAA